MGKILIQIYEIQTPQEAEKLSGLGVDHLGGVLPPDSAPRCPALAQTAAAARAMGARFSLIPLFSNQNTLCRALDVIAPDFVHFCDALAAPDGKLLPLGPALELQERIKQKFPYIRCMRTLPVALPGLARHLDSLALERAFAPITDFFLLDTATGPQGADPVAGFIGITGQTCDWDMAARLVAQSRVPVILAGGIGPDNVFEAIRRVRPAGVDSCTRTNAVGQDGKPLRFVKDAHKVAALVQKARQAEIML